jgi:dihydroorotate dehydrogenase
MQCYEFGQMNAWSIVIMGKIYRYLARPLLFCLSPETAHTITLKTLKYLTCPWWTKHRIPRLKQTKISILGLNFPNPIGLAAGLDKNGDYIDALLGLGFGFIEVGAVTPYPQSGNARPRLFRLPQAQAIINRFGFNNLGVAHLVEQLKKRKVPGIVGVNIGKNATTPLEMAFEDYRFCLEAVYPYADYVTINISSPNTVNLRHLQSTVYLNDLLNNLKQIQSSLEKQYQKKCPLLLKIAPDLNDSEMQDVAHLALRHHIDGLVATNTTTQRPGVENLRYEKELGGLSGRPLFPLALRVVTQLHQIIGDAMPIIAVGGIMSAKEAKAFLNAGASLVQIYTGLVYQGPGLVKEIMNQV